MIMWRGFFCAIFLLGGYFIKHIANIITSLRLVFAVAIFFIKPFSVLFWIFYVLCGLTDIIDGPIARKTKGESDFGAKLDSVADLVFLVSIAFAVLKSTKISAWIYVMIAVLSSIRIISYIIGYVKYHTYSSLHTLMNKATGLLLFLFPILFALFGVNASAIILGTVAFLSSLEELVITIRSKELNRNIKSIIKK